MQDEFGVQKYTTIREYVSHVSSYCKYCDAQYLYYFHTYLLNDQYVAIMIGKVVMMLQQSKCFSSVMKLHYYLWTLQMAAKAGFILWVISVFNNNPKTLIDRSMH